MVDSEELLAAKFEAIFPHPDRQQADGQHDIGGGHMAVGFIAAPQRDESLRPAPKLAAALNLAAGFNTDVGA